MMVLVDGMAVGASVSLQAGCLSEAANSSSVSEREKCLPPRHVNEEKNVKNLALLCSRVYICVIAE